MVSNIDEARRLPTDGGCSPRWLRSTRERDPNHIISSTPAEDIAAGRRPQKMQTTRAKRMADAHREKTTLGNQNHARRNTVTGLTGKILICDKQQKRHVSVTM